MQLKPNFILKQAITEAAFYSIIFLVVFIGPFYLGYMLIGTDDHKPLIIILSVLGLGFVFFGSIFYIFSVKLTYKSSNYLFKDDRVEYTESFFNQEEKELHYERVIEIVHARSFIQRMFGTGSIVLQTQATATEHGSGMYVKDIFESKAKYQEIRSLIDQYREANKR